MGSISESTSVTLFTHPCSPYGLRVQIALVEKGIPFKPVHVDCSNKPKELLRANPIHGKIPTLVHNGNAVAESLIIMEYLEEAWPEKLPLMPKDALARSKVRFWMDYMSKGFGNMQSIFWLKPSSQREAAMAELQTFFKTLESTMMAYSAGGPFFTGDGFGFLDVFLAPLLCWRLAVETMLKSSIPGPELLPRLHKWMKAMEARKSVVDTLPSGEVVVDFLSKKLKELAEPAAASEVASADK